MSCITEILKLKGDQPVLLPLDEEGKPWIAVEGGGSYNGYEYLVTFTRMGHRCGYVAVPSGHKMDFVKSVHRTSPSGGEYIDYEYDAYDVECHGGITFCKREHELKDLLSVPCDDLWLGFDCAHAYDGKDMELVEKYFGDSGGIVLFYKKHPEFQSHKHEILRSFDYVEQQCKSIIDQLMGA